MSDSPVPSDSSQVQDRRGAKRIPLEAIVHYQLDGSEFINLSSDLSSDGIFIKNFSPPAVGTELEIKVTLPADMGSQQVDLRGRVMRVVSGPEESNPGMGIAFTSIQARSPEAIRFFVTEIYQIDDLKELAAEDLACAGDESEIAFSPSKGAVLPIHSQREGGTSRTQNSPQVFVDPRQRLIWCTLLLIAGIVLGAGTILVFFR